MRQRFAAGMLRRDGVQQRGQQRRPQARLIAVGSVQNPIGAETEGFDILLLPLADMGPHIQRFGGVVAAGDGVPVETPRQTEVLRFQAAQPLRVGVFLPDGRIHVENRLRGKMVGDGGIEGMQPFHHHDAVPAVHQLGAAGLLGNKIKHRGLAHAGFIQTPQTVAEHRQVQRLKTLIVIGAVLMLGIAALPQKKVIQTQHLRRAAKLGHRLRQLVGGGGFSGGGRAGEHDDVTAR